MATVSKLVLGFLTDEGKKKDYSYNYADPNVEASAVKALMTGMITNGSIFSVPPISSKSAKIVTTQETSIDLS